MLLAMLNQLIKNCFKITSVATMKIREVPSALATMNHNSSS